MVKYEPQVLREQVEALVHFLMTTFPTAEMHLEQGTTGPAQMKTFTLEEAKGLALDLIRDRFVAPIQGGQDRG
jgi:hypothetical protein